MNEEVDYAWEHAKKIVKANKVYAVCNYCSHTMEGVIKLKFHLANVKGFIEGCEKVPQAVKEGFRNNFYQDSDDPELLFLKMNQTRVPPETRPCDDVSSSHVERPRHSKSRKMMIERLEERVRKSEEEIEELKEEIKKLKRDAN